MHGDEEGGQFEDSPLISQVLPEKQKEVAEARFIFQKIRPIAARLAFSTENVLYEQKHKFEKSKKQLGELRNQVTLPVYTMQDEQGVWSGEAE